MSEDVEMELELLEAAYGPDFALLRENSCEVKLNKDFTVRLIFPESYPASIFVADFRSVLQVHQIKAAAQDWLETEAKQHITDTGSCAGCSFQFLQYLKETSVYLFRL